MATETDHDTTASPEIAVPKRLEPRDVRAIFECLHEGKPAPPYLPFQIVPVDSRGLRLSPPSHEFPGTYEQYLSIRHYRTMVPN